MRSLLLLFVGVVLGAGCQHARSLVAPPAYPFEVVLHRFALTEGKRERFKAWVDFLHAHHAEAVSSLQREQTYFEAMFSDPQDASALFWVEVRGRGGAAVESSPLEVDRVHLDFMREVLRPGSHARLKTENVLVPEFIVESIRQQAR